MGNPLLDITVKVDKEYLAKLVSKLNLLVWQTNVIFIVW